MRRRSLILVIACSCAVAAVSGAYAAALGRSARASKPATSHGLSAPSLLSPSNGARAQQIPVLTWSAVSGAAEYEYQIAADPMFHSIVLGKGPGMGFSTTHNLAAALAKPLTDGTYYWRVRPLTKGKEPGPWSRTRSLVKDWSQAPQPLDPAAGAAITWPSVPLVLRWTPVASATQYILTISTDPSLSNSVIGSAASPTKTWASVFALPGTLPAGQYYWAITPVDASGHRGARSPVRTFTWSWPTTTATSVTPLNDPFGASELEWTPEFTWSPIPGAARYQVEVSSATGFPVGSIWSNTTTIGTSYSPTIALNNNEYYWRVRAIDASGNAGVWNEGPRFTKTFDHQTPTIENLEMVDINQHPTPPRPTTETPIVTWSPVAGAGSYEVQIGRIEGTKYDISTPAQATITKDTITVKEPEKPTFTIVANLTKGSATMAVTNGANKLLPNYTGQQLSDGEKGIVGGTALVGLVDYACDSLTTVTTASTAWTPLATGGHIGQQNWPRAQDQSTGMTNGASYCVSVAAVSDTDTFAHLIESALTPIGHLYEAAFTYDTRFDRCERAHNFETEATELEAKGHSAEAARERQDANAIYNSYETLTPLECEEVRQYPEPASTTPSTAYDLPHPGTASSRTPLFTWEPVLGTTEYYVVIARNPQFTNVVDVAETYGNAYAPPIGNEEPLDDETTQYYWVVIPAKGGAHVGLWEANNPQSFNKSSIAPRPLAPAEGAEIASQPTFKWTPVSGETSDGARNYTVQVAANPTFSSPIDNVTTDSTSYTSSSTYPAHQTLYWRVRANDAHTGPHEGLNWSFVRTFQRTLPQPTPSPDNPTAGQAIPVLTWAPVPGATAYEIHAEQPDGTTQEFTFDSPAFTASQWDGPGIWRWQVRALFPTSSGFGTVLGPYFAPQPFAHTMDSPSGAVGVKTGSRIVISWQPEAYAKEYEVQISTTNTFSTVLETRRTDQASWAPNVDYTKPANRRTLYWRVASIDNKGNVGPFAEGHFGAPPAHPRCVVKRVRRGRRIVKICVVQTHRAKHH